MFEYVNENYKVNASLGLDVYFNGSRGVIVEDCGHYLGVNFDSDKPGIISNVHPTDELLTYGNKHRKIRRMSRSQQNYSDYLRSEVDCTFAEWMGFK